MIEYLGARGPYLLFALLLVLGTYLLLSHRNLLKAVVGLYLVQTGIILFFILVSVQEGATVPILPDPLPGVQAPPGAADAAPAATDPRPEAAPPAEAPLANPLPHALMLTAIVVGVATLGVALAILRRIQAETGSLEDVEEQAPI